MHVIWPLVVRLISEKPSPPEAWSTSRVRRLVIHGQAPTLACPTGRSIPSAQSAASPFGLLPTMQRSPRTGLILRQWRSQRRNRIPGSSPAAVPLACHSQQSRPVPSGQPRTTMKRPRPAPFAILAGDSSTRSGFGSRWSVDRGLHWPCRAQPADPVPNLWRPERQKESHQDWTFTRVSRFVE